MYQDSGVSDVPILHTICNFRTIPQPTRAPVGNLGERVGSQSFLRLRMDEINAVLVDSYEQNLWIVGFRRLFDLKESRSKGRPPVGVKKVLLHHYCLPKWVGVGDLTNSRWLLRN